MANADNKAFQLVYYQGGKLIYARLNFSYVASTYAGNGLGFGVERCDFSKGTRKTVQQTRGTITPDNVTDNFYVDTWWTSPPKVILTGAVQMVAGSDDTVKVGYVSDGSNSTKENKGFLGTIDEMFKRNNHPYNVQAGDIIQFHDYTRQQYYQVSLKNFNTSASIDRPNMLTFTLEMDVLADIGVTGVNSSATNQQPTLIDSIQNIFAGLGA
jgi:hypothetical protein